MKSPWLVARPRQRQDESDGRFWVGLWDPAFSSCRTKYGWSCRASGELWAESVAEAVWPWLWYFHAPPPRTSHALLRGGLWRPKKSLCDATLHKLRSIRRRSEPPVCAHSLPWGGGRTAPPKEFCGRVQQACTSHGQDSLHEAQQPCDRDHLSRVLTMAHLCLGLRLGAPCVPQPLLAPW